MSNRHVMTGGVWPPHMGLSSRKLSALDEYTSELANFDEGGFYTPKANITVGGKGMTLGSTSQIQGGVTTMPGYGGNDPRIELVDQWPVFSASRTKSTCLSFSEGDIAQEQRMRVNANGSVTNAVDQDATPFTLTAAVVLDGHRVHDDASLTKATVSFRYIGTKPTAVGTEDFYVVRRLRSTGAEDTPNYLHTAGVVSGILYSAFKATRNAPTVDSYFNAGNVINIEYEPNQNNTMSQANYYYEFRFVASVDVEVFGVKLDFAVFDQRFE